MTQFKAVVFDWAGTLVDYGCFAPAEAFREAFARFDIEVTAEEARAPMGLPKRDHIAAMLAMPRVTNLWAERHGRACTAQDIDAIYEVFLPLNIAVVGAHAEPVPGAATALAELRAMGLKIGSTTGYTRDIMAALAPLAAERGIAPDTIVCSDDLKEGRPGPLGMYQCFVDLAVYPSDTMIKVDDTAPGIAEGKSAGCLSVGVALSGNHMGMTSNEVQALTREARDENRRRISDILMDAGADHVIDTVADLPALIPSISTAD